MNNWTITIFEADRPLHQALALRLPGVPSAFLRQLCKKERVLLDGNPGGGADLVEAGQRLTLKGSLRLDAFLEESPLPPGWFLYEDAHCLVLDKPAGLAVHRASGQEDDLTSRVKAFMRLRGEKFRCAPVQRLDIGTSGPVLIAKGRAAAAQLGKALMDGQMEKAYLALVAGVPPQRGELLSPVPAKGKLKEARCHFRRVSRGAGFSLLELQLLTGRQHQLRRQLAEAGWPILGDRRYRGPERAGLQRPFLHCCRLSFPQPGSGQTIGVEAPLPEELCRLLDTLQLTGPTTGPGR